MSHVHHKQHHKHYPKTKAYHKSLQKQSDELITTQFQFDSYSIRRVMTRERFKAKIMQLNSMTKDIK
jgi:hypothetical protein